MSERLSKLGKNKYVVKGLMLILDVFLVCFALYASFWLRFEGQIPQQYWDYMLSSLIPVCLLSLASFGVFNMYNRAWRFASIDALLATVESAFVLVLLTIAFTYMFNMPFPRSVYILFFVLTVVFVGSSRLFYRTIADSLRLRLSSEGDRKNVIIAGGGQAGALTIRELRANPKLNMVPVAIVDDDPNKTGTRVLGVPVVGKPELIPSIAKKKSAFGVIIAMPSAPRSRVREIVEICTSVGLRVKTIPSLYDLITGRANVSNVRDIQIEDLLGREPVKAVIEDAASYLRKKVVLVTGAAGSIGSELVMQVAQYDPELIVLLDISENGLFDMEHKLKREIPQLRFVTVVGSVRDADRINEIMVRYGVQVVFHAAAHKHVPLMESNAAEAIKNNVLGTLNTCKVAAANGVERFILISTDKAVKPKNVMGASKRLAELIIQLMNQQSDFTVFTAVRFGNVLGSAGSVVPVFKKQIEMGGPVTVTHPEATRYFMTIPEAVQLVLEAGALAKGGEVFVLDMGEPVSVLSLAENMIRLSGFEPYKDIEIVFTGLRPGEKLHEELFEEKEDPTLKEAEKIYRAKLVSDPEAIEGEYIRLKEMLIKIDPQTLVPLTEFEKWFYQALEMVKASVPRAVDN